MNDKRNGVKSSLYLNDLEKRALKIWGGSIEITESLSSSIKDEVVLEAYDISVSGLGGAHISDTDDNPLLDVDDYNQSQDEDSFEEDVDIQTEYPIHSSPVEHIKTKHKRRG